MHTTSFELGRGRRLRDWLGGDGPATRGAQLFMFLAALLCGAVLAGLLFVGIWRHTAGEAATNQAARLSDQRALEASRRTAADLRARLATEEALLVKAGGRAAAVAAALRQARAELVRDRASLDRVEAADAAKLGSLSTRMSSLSAPAGELAREASTLRSELSALEGYVANPGPSGVDPGYLAAQARYLEQSAAAAASAAADLARRTTAGG